MRVMLKFVYNVLEKVYLYTNEELQRDFQQSNLCIKDNKKLVYTQI